LNFYNSADDAQSLKTINETLDEVTDPNEQISFLRAGVISRLVNECVHVFTNKLDAILNGEYQHSLINEISPVAQSAMQKVVDVSVKRIYADHSVIEIELAGYKVISTLMEHFIDAMLTQNKYNSKLLKLFPEQFMVEPDASAYSKVQSVLDFVSGMTDVYALDLYRKITGINIPGIG
jgi:dGTPase